MLFSSLENSRKEEQRREKIGKQMWRRICGETNLWKLFHRRRRRSKHNKIYGSKIHCCWCIIIMELDENAHTHARARAREMYGWAGNIMVGVSLALALALIVGGRMKYWCNKTIRSRNNVLVSPNRQMCSLPYSPYRPDMPACHHHHHHPHICTAIVLIASLIFVFAPGN